MDQPYVNSSSYFPLLTMYGFVGLCSIGSLGTHKDEAGVHNVTVTNSIFDGTQNGVRIKSWAQPSNGYASNIVFRNLTMKNANNPIIIDQNYCPGDKSCPHQVSCYKKNIFIFIMSQAGGD